MFPLGKTDSSVKCNECYAMLRTEHYEVFQFGQPTSSCIFMKSDAFDLSRVGQTKQ